MNDSHVYVSTGFGQRLAPAALEGQLLCMSPNCCQCAAVAAAAASLVFKLHWHACQDRIKALAG